jgi:hypothetical protein
MATVSGKFTFAGADEAAQDAIVQALLSNRSSDAIKEALAQSITSEAGIDGEIIVTEVLASVEGTLEFNFGEAAAFFATAYEDPNTKGDIEHTLQVAFASGLPDVNASAVKIIGAVPSAGRRLTGSTRVNFAIAAPLGTSRKISAQVTAIDTSTIAAKTAEGFREVAEAKPEIAGLAEVEPMLAPPESPTIALVVEYEVAVIPGERDDIAFQLSSIESSSLTEAVATNMQDADESLTGISILAIDQGEFEVYESTAATTAPTATPTVPATASHIASPTASPEVSPTASPDAISVEIESQEDVGPAGKTNAQPSQAGRYAFAPASVLFGAALVVFCCPAVGVGLAWLVEVDEKTGTTETKTTSHSNVEQGQTESTREYLEYREYREYREYGETALNQGAPEQPSSQILECESSPESIGSAALAEESLSSLGKAEDIQLEKVEMGSQEHLNQKTRSSIVPTMHLADVMADLEPGAKAKAAPLTNAPVGACSVFSCAPCRRSSGHDPVAPSVVAGTPSQRFLF